MKVGEVQIRNNIWRLNEELLQDKVVEDRVREELEQFFRVNDTKEIMEATVRETHKAYIMGILIMVGSKKKKRTKENKIALTKEIYELEQQKKKRRDKELLLKLSIKREVMRELVEQES